MLVEPLDFLLFAFSGRVLGMQLEAETPRDLYESRKTIFSSERSGTGNSLTLPRIPSGSSRLWSGKATEIQRHALAAQIMAQSNPASVTALTIAVNHPVRWRAL